MTHEAELMTSHGAVAHVPPSPAAIGHLRSSNWAGSLLLSSAALLTVAGVALSLQRNVWVWLFGQAVLAVTLVQWFALLHECGHGTLFRSKTLHAPAGRVAAFFSLIPYYCWKRVHGRHHKWTGWQDLDPTTAALVPRTLGRGERALMNVCWRYWIPLFATLYRVNNFWHLPRLRSLFREQEDRRRMTISIITFLLAYVAVVIIVGPWTLLRVTGVAFVFAFIVEDLLILSQHTHIPSNLSQGRQVPPFPALEQDVFTRSLILPSWISAMLLRIDAHELHHMYPSVPGYRLHGISHDTPNKIGWWKWVKGARALPGETLMFHNRIETGADI
ncbi:MAG TPA: fatty acid desaturase [Pyrinomonadaceae bacterium]|nr:fatty acid desaturase [Pyrinomonadaceae bacterium]